MSLDDAANYLYWQRNGAYWANEYDRRKKVPSTVYYHLQEFMIASFLEHSAPARVLEFGCGVGRHLRYLRDIPGIDVHGFDQSLTMIEAIADWAPIEWVDQHIRTGAPVGRLPYEDQCFDIVFTTEVLVHCRPADVEDILRELIRVARWQVFHLEPGPEYEVFRAAHDGCWSHDLMAIYTTLGCRPEVLERAYPSHTPLRIVLDPTRPRYSFPSVSQRLLRRLESDLSGSQTTPAASTIQQQVSTESVAALFPSQVAEPVASTIPAADEALGAPHAPLPRSLISIDPRLAVCQSLPDEAEINGILRLRSPFRVGDYPDPYMNDVVRAFRLLGGKRTYAEIGTFDRGNLAYVSTLLADDALLIGLDTQDEPRRDALLRERLKPGQTYVPVVGNSRSPECLARVREILGDRMLDAIFIDGDHTAYAVMSDYANFESMVADDGVILLHDSVWEGNAEYKGVVDALDEINRKDRVYLIDGKNPCREFSRPTWRQEMWGVVGLVFADEQAWRKRGSNDRK